MNKLNQLLMMERGTPGQGLKAAESLYRELKHAQYDIHVGDDTYRCAKCAGSRQTDHAADCTRAKALRDWEEFRDAD